VDKRDITSCKKRMIEILNHLEMSDMKFSRRWLWQLQAYEM